MRSVLLATSSASPRPPAVEGAPVREAVLVLGAPPGQGGAPTALLAARLRTAAALLHAGKAPSLLVSGRPAEVAVMVAALSALGVPKSALWLDGESFRTLDSCARARRVFRLRAPLVVTQAFHLPRALYLARACGLDPAGVAAPDTELSLAVRARLEARERLAWARARFDVTLGSLHHGRASPP